MTACVPVEGDDRPRIFGHRRTHDATGPVKTIGRYNSLPGIAGLANDLLKFWTAIPDRWAMSMPITC